MNDLTINIDLTKKEDLDKDFSRISELMGLFEAIINELSDLTGYEIKMRGKNFDYWIENPTSEFKKESE